MNKNDVMVTVVCITYNHEEFIAQALDSFLMQKTNFKYQIFVGEDCGPDKTADIIKQYAEQYPDIIVPFLRQQNMGAQRNLIDLCNHATSPYIAFCEGDDYWIDEYKLQKQFDYMEANPEVKVCFAQAEINAPEDWFLNSYYKKNDAGKMIFPECDPAYIKKSGYLKAKDFISFFQAHTSTLFYRWNYNLTLPDWYYQGYYGDWPLFLMHLADGYAGYLPETMSVYRRSDVGVYMSKDMDSHFLKTRIENIRILSNMINFFEETCPKDYPKILMENKIKNDVSIFVQTALKQDNYEALIQFIHDYPDAAKLGFNTFIGFYNDSKRMTHVYSWEGNQAVARDRYFMHALKPIVRFYLLVKKYYHKLKNKLIKSTVYLAKLLGYWIYAIVPKERNLWAFSSFYKRGYMDNSKYFYEYLIEHHPEIRAVWFTKDNTVYEKLKKEQKEVYKMNSFAGIRMMAKAAVAVTDHFVMSDYSSIYGFNYKTKIVQLWHGVGFKALSNGKKIVNSDVPGVRYSNDIICTTADSRKEKFKKHIKFFFKAPVRELFERYYMLVCPGKERTIALGETLHIPSKAYCYAGHPRNINLYHTEIAKNPYKILYAPTYRFRESKEKELLKNFFFALPKIQHLMEELNATFVLRLHPHTWRNYKPIIVNKIKNYDRIELDEEKDIYSSLASYSLVITDYSSIALDFAMLNRPTVYYTFDYEWFTKNESGFTKNFEELIPGPQTFSWEDTLQCIKKCMEEPNWYSDIRKQRCSYFFDAAVNTEQNSHLICEELKQRLGIIK